MAKNNISLSRFNLIKPNCKLVEWKLQKFKGIQNQTIPLAPLSVIVGKNSSGKSSFIQSILFMAQNAANPIGKSEAELGRLDLNGDLVSLGGFNETLHDGSEESDGFSIGGKLSYLYRKEMEFQSFYPSKDGVDESIKGKSGLLEWKTIFKPVVSQNDSSIVESFASEANLYFEEEHVQTISSSKNLIIRAINEEQRVSGMNYESSATLTTQGKLESISKDFRTYYANTPTDIKFEAITHLSGVPVNGLVSTPQLNYLFIKQRDFFNSRRAQAYLRSYFTKLFENSKVKSQKIESSIIEKRFNSALNNYPLRSILKDKYENAFETVESAIDIFCKESLDQANSGIIDNRLREQLSRQPLIPIELIPFKIRVPNKFPKTIVSNKGMTSSVEHDTIFLTITDFSKNIDKFDFDLDYIVGETARELLSFWVQCGSRINQMITLASTNSHQNMLTKAGDIYIDEYISHDAEADEFTFGEGVQNLDRFLREIVYLGPLRLEPKDIYERNIGRTNPQTPLGMRGELLAKVVFENPLGNFPLPPKNQTTLNEINIARNSSFTEALNAWLKYLGISKLNGVEVIPDRHYGYRLTVDGRYLRSLGVGVSQVIPVIGVCLLAEQGSLILLEEPEIHLNPSIQQKLAEFLLVIGQSGRQVIAESHSEYLITRLRLLAMQNPKLASEFNFIFTEQKLDKKVPYTTFTEIKPNTTGELPDWPEGFFDQVTQDIQNLIEEMIKREKD
jgi:predicted ATPase